MKKFIYLLPVFLIACVVSMATVTKDQKATPSNPYPDAYHGLHLYDDFVGGLSGSGQVGPFMRFGVNAGGYGNGLTAGSGAVGVAGRVGIVEIGIGTTNNGTGQAFLTSDSALMYAGMADMVMTWSAAMPGTLSNASVEYVIEMGFGSYPFEGATNGIAIQYKRTTSTNFSGYAVNNGTPTGCTTSDSANFAVTAGAWYNFKIVVPIAGTSASLFVAPANSAKYVLLCKITSNLPDISNQAAPFFDIYKGGSSTTNRTMLLDWWQLDATFAHPR